MTDTPDRSDRIDYVGSDLDDVAIFDVDCFRLEFMSANHVWIRLYRKDGRDVVINLNARGKIHGSHEYD